VPILTARWNLGRGASIWTANGGISHETRQNNSRRSDSPFWRDARFPHRNCHASERFDSRGERNLYRHTGRALVAASLWLGMGMEAPLCLGMEAPLCLGMETAMGMGVA
jgi:hypothetical protein